MNKKKLTQIILKGIPASSGVAKGMVKIVKGIKDIRKFREGDILVTEMTEPSMAIMMNKAAAIVTDKGGLTCHAAIISRELGIPCVVATKKATKTLKDGERIKVDGTKGQVVIISG